MDLQGTRHANLFMYFFYNAFHEAKNKKTFYFLQQKDRDLLTNSHLLGSET